MCNVLFFVSNAILLRILPLFAFIAQIHRATHISDLFLMPLALPLVLLLLQFRFLFRIYLKDILVDNFISFRRLWRCPIFTVNFCLNEMHQNLLINRSPTKAKTNAQSAIDAVSGKVANWLPDLALSVPKWNRGHCVHNNHWRIQLLFFPFSFFV